MTVLALQGWIGLALGLAALVLELYALVDAVRHPPAAYLAAGKRTKGLWVAVTAVAVAIGFLSIYQVLSLVSIIAIVAAAVYVTDVRPALQQVRGRRGSQGPYGRW